MRLPLSWLKRYITTGLSAEKMAEVLTMSGTAVEGVHTEGTEAVLEIEVTTNRPDCLSVLGLARELAALTGKKISLPKITTTEKALTSSPSALTFPTIEIIDRNNCLYYTARLISGLQHGITPQEIQTWLTLMKARPINAAVDATNFVLFETGQPLHAFDYEKIEGSLIQVRRAKSGEKFLGIDGIEYTLDAATLVIADAKKPIAIAGVMGGKLTEVTDSTRHILVESAFFDPALVREASRKYKLVTESSYRFERRVCPENVSAASRRVCDLITAWAGGSVEGKLFEFNAFKKNKAEKIQVRLDRLSRCLGIAVPPKKILSILKALGFAARLKGKNVIEVEKISLRKDVQLEADVAEEILRIIGFDKVPARLPVESRRYASVEDKKNKGIAALKRWLAAAGFNEIMTYSLLSEKMLSQSGFNDLTEAVKIKNPVSLEQEYLRPSLLPGMLQSLIFNIHRKATSLKFFEIGNCMAGNQEQTFLAMSLYGPLEENWRHKQEASFFDLKGLANNLLGFLKIKNASWEPAAERGYDYASVVKTPAGSAGILGKINTEILKAWDIPASVFYFEMVLDTVAAGALKGPELTVVPAPRFPLVRRDVAILVSKQISTASIERSLREAGGTYLKDIQLFDEFTGKNIQTGKRSLAFSLAYQKESGTFTDEEIAALHEKICQKLVADHHAELR